MSRVLVTGASGFIGSHLVGQLVDEGREVGCLVRKQSRTESLQRTGARLIIGDVTDADSLTSAFRGSDVVYHLAGATKALNRTRLQQVNVDGTCKVARACADQPSPPVLVLISSLAAVGPARAGRPVDENDKPLPVSNYGRSKLNGELAACAYSHTVPITIVRPPIVLGEGDRDGLNLFESIARWNLHLVPGLSDHRYSVIHADDLARAIRLAASKGQRVQSEATASGRYFATDPVAPTYAQLGQMIGKAVGRNRVRIVRSPNALVRGIALVNESFSQIRRSPHILGVDKAREATAGSWYCTGASLERDTGFQTAMPLEARLRQVAEWYVHQGWLPRRRAKPATTTSAKPSRLNGAQCGTHE
ncbi:MAG: NAD-dependent epimerase/dehydratase family protein [Planctomycetota bacterium]